MFFSISCRTIIPSNKKVFEMGYFYQYDKLDFNKIADANDSSWHKQIRPLANLLRKNQNWKVKLKTFLADSSTLDFFDKNRLDVVVVRNINNYLVRLGCDVQQLIPTAYNNVDDKYRYLIYRSFPPPKKYKLKHFKKNTFEWEILRID